MSVRRYAFAAALAMAGACERSADAPTAAVRRHERPAPALAPGSDRWLEVEAARYLDDAGFRRETLEASLTRPSNVYSRTRLSSYGLGARGWDQLPVWVPRTMPVDAEYVTALQHGVAVWLDDAAKPLWDGSRPTTLSGWVELGRRVFYAYPLRPEVFAEHALRDPALAVAVGLTATADGQWPGVVAFQDVDGSARIGITCALCHVAVEQGQAVEGRARRNLDYGKMRLAYHHDTGAPLPKALARRMAAWGPGRADITQDDDEDPVAIVDLWGVRGRAYLTQAGTVRHVHPAALAIRQETQILHANRERTRPPRELAWALAMFVYALQPPPRDRATTADVERGRVLFGEHCRGCHSDEHGAGDLVAARTVGTDTTLAFGHARGTGKYRPSPLVRVAEAAPYLHHGVVPTLAALLSPARFDPGYVGGSHGPGPIPGHRWGTRLPMADREALLGFLDTL